MNWTRRKRTMRSKRIHRGGLGVYTTAAEEEAEVNLDTALGMEVEV